MDLTNAKALLAKIASDPEVAKTFASLTTSEAFDAEAKKLGYTCTVEEFNAARKEAPANAEGKMEDGELAQTSGGLSMLGVDYTIAAVQATND